MAGKFPNLMKTIHSHMQKVQQTPSAGSMEKNTSRHITIDC